MTNEYFNDTIIHIKQKGCVKIPTIEQELDWQIYFAKNNNCEDLKNAVAFVWTSNNNPLTLRTAYPQLKKLLEPSENGCMPQNPKVVSNGKHPHRPPLFTEEQKQEIAYKYTHYNASKSSLAKEYRCSEKTIRNILKGVLK